MAAAADCTADGSISPGFCGSSSWSVRWQAESNRPPVRIAHVVTAHRARGVKCIMSIVLDGRSELEVEPERDVGGRSGRLEFVLILGLGEPVVGLGIDAGERRPRVE